MQWIQSDVYSFGVLLLEIIKGMKNSGFHHPEHGPSLVTSAWRLWNEGRGVELIDSKIVNDCPLSETLRRIHIALLCVQENPADRPTMSSVVLMLGSNSVDLPKPLEPPFSVGRWTMSDYSSATTRADTGLSMTDQSTTSAK